MQSPSREHRELVGVLRARRVEVAQAFADARGSMSKWQPLMRSGRADWPAFLQLHFFVFADYLIEHFEQGGYLFKSLFVGESLKALYDPDLTDAELATAAAVAAAGERSNLEALLRGGLSNGAWATLANCLAEVHRTISAQGGRTQRVLLVGDCIFLDIMPFIAGALLEEGVNLIVDYAASKNPFELHDQLRAFSSRKFDLIFFSPYTYEFSLAYSQLADWRNSLLSKQRVREMVEEAWGETKTSLDLMADLFDCPIHVHNSSAVVRAEKPVSRRLRLTATSRVRLSAKQQVNGLLADYALQRNAQSFRHLFVFDENAIMDEAGEFAAGAYLYRSQLQHPAALGQMLAAAYIDIIYVNAWLAKRKMVVCDLDNTLWDGVIGEGEVAHHHARQCSLKALKGKGVVLAIASKNDPTNVHWKGGSLSEDDFVYLAINWRPKVQAMTDIHSELNLKTKDSVFIDDREDEREMMRLSHADVLCLDATDPSTWRRIALWETSLEDDAGMDRTLMYRQREGRKAFVRDDIASEEEKAALFRALRLKLTISRAKPDDLKRIAELINRTNQFNLEGSRTTLKEVREWHHSPEHLVLIGQTGDRFGDMGTTCVAVAHINGAEMELLPFVLSCRVFGYGIERSVMNHLRALARQAGAKRIVGRYVPTPQNAPCKDFLADNGFEEGAGGWAAQVDAGPTPNVEWLEVVVTK